MEYEVIADEIDEIVERFDLEHIPSNKCGKEMIVDILRKHYSESQPKAAKDARELDNNRCAICGWPLGNCKRGDCAMRPFPARYYDAKRAMEEYAPSTIPDEALPTPTEQLIKDLQTRAEAAERKVEEMKALNEAYSEQNTRYIRGLTAVAKTEQAHCYAETPESEVNEIIQPRFDLRKCGDIARAILATSADGTMKDLDPRCADIIDKMLDEQIHSAEGTTREEAAGFGLNCPKCEHMERTEAGGFLCLDDGPVCHFRPLAHEVPEEPSHD
jgi:hypothetical protein